MATTTSGTQVAQAEKVTPSWARARAAALPAALSRLWGARGLFGGVAAILLAYAGQRTLLDGQNPEAALRYYVAAIILLLLSLLHPALPTLLRRRKNADAVPVVATASTLPTRVARAQEETASTGPWMRWKALRAWLGWRATVAGSALTLALAAASAVVLVGDITKPVGGWLWAAAMLVLLLTFTGVEGWPRGEGLMPGPASDFFRKGIPALAFRWEAILLAAVLLVALFMRLYNLETMPGIFGDEGERGMDARAINQGNPTLIFGYGWWGVPNLYFYIVSFFLRTVGDNMTGDRMLSVLSNVLAVYFIYKIGRLLWGARAGLIAGALLAVSPVALQFSRQAGESTPTGALWTIGFYFCFMALRYRRWSDWVLSGMAWGFALYFYAAGKLIIPIAAAVAGYCLIRWQLDFFKKYALGFALMGVAFALTFMPYGVFSAKDGWNGFMGRAKETSIFSEGNKQNAFAKYGIDYPYSTPPDGSLVKEALAHPVPWAALVFNQLRLTTEVLYKNGDPTFFFKTQEHNGSLLAPLWAALALLGLAYGAWKFWDGRFGLINIWFWGGMLGAALTMDTPSVQRLTGAWPVLMLFPAVMLDRVVAAGWPLNLGLARKWSAVPLAGMLIFFGGNSYREYFDSYYKLCPYCDITAQSRFAQDLGQDYKAYEMGVGDYDVFFGYGSTRFIAKGVEGRDLSVPSDGFPATDNNGKGLAYIILSNNQQYIPLIQTFYPAAPQVLIKSYDDQPRFVSFKLTREQLAAYQTLHATYTSASGTVKRDEPGLGATQSVATGAQVKWTAPQGVSFPAAATWEGGVVAPTYGLYTIAVRGGTDAKLVIDGKTVWDDAAPGSDPATRGQVVLARGIHDVRLTDTLQNANSHLDVTWNGGPIASNMLYNGTTGGLVGEVGPLSGDGSAQMASDDPFKGVAVAMRRSDPFFGFRQGTDSLGQGAFFARWRGKLDVKADGAYTFNASCNGSCLLKVDGQQVIQATASGNVTAGTGQATLTPGQHDLELRYMWTGGPSRLELAWTPPGGEHTIIPPTAFIPAQRAWLPGELPDAVPAASVPTPTPPADTVLLVQPEQVIGADAGLKSPRGIAVDAEGNIYVGDRNNSRVVAFSPDGKLLRTFGKPPATKDAPPGPGEIADIADLAATPDGTIYVMDNKANRVLAFTKDGTLAHTYTSDVLQTNGVNGLGLAPDGSLLFADTVGGRLGKVAFGAGAGANKPVSSASTASGDGANKLEQPVDVASDGQGDVFAIDLKNRIVQLGANGAITAQWNISLGLDDGGSRLAASADGKKVYMSDSDRNRVATLDVATGNITYFGGAGSDPGQLKSPCGIAVSNSHIYLLDRGNNRVQVFALPK